MSFFLETARLILREFHPNDTPGLFLLNSDAEVMRYTGDEPFGSMEEASRFIAGYAEYRENGFGRWAVLQRDTRRFIGWCGLKGHREEYVDLGFRFLKSEWGKGYATESAKAALNAGFEDFDLEEIVGRVSPENTASVKVLEKLGMKFWKRDNCKGIADASYYRITNAQFDSFGR